MKKYVVWTLTTGDWYQEIYDNELNAIAYADAEYARQDYENKPEVLRFFVTLCEFDEDGIPDLETADIIKEYK